MAGQRSRGCAALRRHSRHACAGGGAQAGARQGHLPGTAPAARGRSAQAVAQHARGARVGAHGALAGQGDIGSAQAGALQGLMPPAAGADGAWPLLAPRLHVLFLEQVQDFCSPASRLRLNGLCMASCRPFSSMQLALSMGSCVPLLNVNAHRLHSALLMGSYVGRKWASFARLFCCSSQCSMLRKTDYLQFSSCTERRAADMGHAMACHALRHGHGRR